MQTPPECALIGGWATHSSDLVHWFSIWAESSWGSQRAEVIYARTARRTVEFPVISCKCYLLFNNVRTARCTVEFPVMCGESF